MAEKYRLVESGQFRRGRKLAKNRGLDMALLKWAIEQLAQDIPLPSNWKDHQLKGKLRRFRECHIGVSGDWLLVYEKREADMILYLIGTGTRDDLLGR
ncbi:MAG: type II toxin-antitoxin system YafQ family toxin [Clostridiales Family XIII bacterium]|jgi:mRNA interferase YafQ|nr:type II toxin-antitoxin system YafQ family toxin [Clostridiales Family XIII bacterium]